MNIDIRFTLLFDFRQDELGDIGHFLSAEGDLDSRNTDVLEQHVEVCRRKIRRRDAEAERVDTCVEDFQCLTRES